MFHQTLSDLSDQAPDETDAITQEQSIDVTAFLFPAIGALLMLMFGGLLFSSGTALCKTKTMSDDKYKRKFEQQYGRRTIRFHNIPEKIAKEPSSVLQQENNDIVDAVRKEYQDLPQYQPVSGLVGNIAGLYGHTCAVNISRPEVTDRGVSPIHFTTKGHTSDYENPSYRDKDSNTELENDANKKNTLSITLHDKYFLGEDNCTQRNPTTSSGIGTNSPDSYETDSLEEFPASENDSLYLAETEVPELSGRGFPIDSARPLNVPTIDRGVYSGGRLSVLQIESASSSLCVKGRCNCSIHRTEAEKMDTRRGGTRLNHERLTWGDIALNGVNIGNLARGNEWDASCSDMLRLATPSAEISGPLTADNMREQNLSPLRRADLEKWLHDVRESRKTSDKVYDQTLESPDAEIEKPRKDFSSTQEKQSVSSRRRMRAPLQESLQLLKKLQLVSDDNLCVAQTSVHRGGRASCLNTVRAPSSLCLCAGNCNAHCLNEGTSDQSIEPANPIEDETETESTEIPRSDQQLDSSRTERIAKGGRKSSLNHIRASSGMCIHGPSCRVHCQKMGLVDSITESGIQNERSEKITCTLQERYQQEMHSELKELRGASVFGEAQESLEYNTFNDQGISNCTLEKSDFVKAECNASELRGASSFGDSRSARKQQIIDLNTRGASSFAAEPQNQLRQVNDRHNNTQSLGDIRGASCFAPLDESIAGTSSVTLSFAVESDTESFLADKSLVERKRSGSALRLGTFVGKGRDHTWGSKNTTTEVLPTVKQNLQTNSWKTSDKENFGHDPNSNSLDSHTIDSKDGKKYQELDGPGRHFAFTEKTDFRDEQKQNSKRFDERILKVGKDNTMMCTLLNALRRDGDQKRKASNHNITPRIDKDDVTSDKQASVGSLKFSVLYKGADTATPLLYVTVLGLEGVSDEIVTPGKHGAYVKVCLSPKFTTWRRTRTLDVSEKLAFKDHFIISGVKPVDLEEAILRFVVLSVGEDERDIGQLDVPLKELKSRDKFKRTCALHAPGAMNDGIAKLS